MTEVLSPLVDIRSPPRQPGATPSCSSSRPPTPAYWRVSGAPRVRREHVGPPRPRRWRTSTATLSDAGARLDRATTSRSRSPRLRRQARAGGRRAGRGRRATGCAGTPRRRRSCASTATWRRATASTSCRRCRASRPTRCGRRRRRRRPTRSTSSCPTASRRPSRDRRRASRPARRRPTTRCSALAGLVPRRVPVQPRRPPGPRQRAPSRRSCASASATASSSPARSRRWPARSASRPGSPSASRPGSLQADGSRTVLGKNAHAWPEVWFDGLGWVPFEPTPGRGAPGAEGYTGVAAAQDETVRRRDRRGRRRRRRPGRDRPRRTGARAATGGPRCRPLGSRAVLPVRSTHRSTTGPAAGCRRARCGTSVLLLIAVRLAAAHRAHVAAAPITRRRRRTRGRPLAARGTARWRRRGAVPALVDPERGRRSRRAPPRRRLPPAARARRRGDGHRLLAPGRVPVDKVRRSGSSRLTDAAAAGAARSSGWPSTR